MRNAIFHLIAIIMGFLSVIDRCFAQTDSIMNFEAFHYDEYGNITLRAVSYNTWYTSGRNEKLFYESWTAYAGTFPSSDNLFIQNMLEKRILNKPIYSGSMKGHNGTTDWTNTDHQFFVYDTTFSFLPIAQYHVPYGMTDYVLEPNFNSANLTIDSRFRKSFQVDSIDTYGRPLQVTDRAGISSCYLYSPKGLLVGKVQNATLQDIAYSNFSNSENKIDHGWTIANPASGGSGSGFDSCEKTDLDPSKEYILSFWVVLTNGSVTDHDYQINSYGGTAILIDTLDFMEYDSGLPHAVFTYKISGAQTVSLQKKTVGVGNPYLNKIRLHPADADFQSYAYTVNNGGYKIAQHVNSLNRYNFFMYDERGRLIWILDEKGRLILEKNYTPWNY